MTINEAKEIIEEFKFIDDWSMVYLPGLHEALDMAIDIVDRYHDIKNKYEAQTDVLAQMEQELNWYRARDLIDKKPLIELIEKRLSRYEHGVVMANAIVNLVNEIPKAEPSTMRYATAEEQESVSEYIKSISVPTGVNFYNGDCET